MPDATTTYEPVLLKYVGQQGSHTLEFYRGHGGYEAAKKVVSTMKPDETIELVKQSGLRGRGGAGFGTGQKWSFVPKQSSKPKYLAVNADESEPGTFKDRSIIESDPHQLIEGIIITCWAVGINAAYVYIRGEMVLGAERLNAAIAECYAAGVLGPSVLGSGFKLDVTVHRGAGAYICGEETALLTSLEGNRGYPRLKPPFPAIEGLWRSPTVVNNVETLSNLPHIINRGVPWFRALGTEKSPGPKIFCVSGHVVRPGNYERPMGYSLRKLIYEDAGGIAGGRKLKGVIPGGSSMPILPASKVDGPDVAMDFESVAAAGSVLGSAGVIVMDDTTCMVNAALNITRFYHHESCGQCTPCREGSGWLEKILHRIEFGHGKPGDVEMLLDIGSNMVGKTICVFAEATVWPIEGFLKHFRAEFDEHVKQHRCPLENRLCATAKKPSPAVA